MNFGGSSVDVGSLGGFGEYIQLLEEYAMILLISVIASYVLIFIFACIGGTIAGKKGRKRAGWFFLIFFFGLIPFIIICCLKSKKVQIKYWMRFVVLIRICRSYGIQLPLVRKRETPPVNPAVFLFRICS